MKKITFILIVILFVFTLNSCNKKKIYQGVTEPDIIHKADLFIDSDPKALKVYMDNNYLGIVCPDTVKFLAGGMHRFVLKHELYPDTAFNFELVNGELKSIYIDGFANPHFYNRIYIASDPVKARIIFNDSLINEVTPYLMSHLLPAVYKVKVEFDGHRPDSAYIDVKKGDTKSVEFSLEDTTKFITYKTNNSGIVSNNITAVVADRNDVVWFGTIENGIQTFDGKNWNKIEGPGGVEFKQIKKMEFDKFDRLWVISSSGLFVRDNSSWQNYGASVGINSINDFIFDKDNNIILCTNHGAYYQQGNGWKIFDTSRTCMVNDTVNTAFFESNGRFWLGTRHYAVEFVGDSCAVLVRTGVHAPPPEASMNVAMMFEDEQTGYMWFIHKTVEKEQTDAFFDLERPFWWYKGFPFQYVYSSLINSIYIEKGNGIWFCMENGIAWRRPNTSVLLITQTNSQLPIRNCQQIVRDQKGNYWVACLYNGLIKIKNGVVK